MKAAAFPSLRPAVCRIICLALLGTAAPGQDDKPKSAPSQSPPPAAEKPSTDKSETPGKPRDQQTALKELKAGVESVKAWAKEQKGKTEASPATLLRMVPEFAGRIQKIRTDGLPADLAEQMERMKQATTRFAGLFKDIPAGDEEGMEWLSKKFSDKTFTKEMGVAQAEVSAAGAKLKETAAKYGLTDLEFEAKDSSGEKEEREESRGEESGSGDRNDKEDKKAKEDKEAK